MCATALVAMTALVGVLLLGLNERLLQRTSFVLVAFASGALVGGAGLAARKKFEVVG